MKGIYRIADTVIEIRSSGEGVHALCGAFRSGGTPDLAVEITEADLRREAARTPGAGRDTLESFAVHRRIAEAMPARDTLLLHASALAADGRAYCFAAPSGTGKSTHARLWRRLLGARAVMIDDDKPLLRVGDEARVYGTPWNGKHRLGGPRSAPLAAICFLTRAPENEIRPLRPAEAWPLLLSQAYRPEDPEALRKTLLLLDRLAARIPCYRLACNMDLSAAALAFYAMSGTNAPDPRKGTAS